MTSASPASTANRPAANPFILPIALGVLAAGTTAVWFIPDRSESAVEAAAAGTLGRTGITAEQIEGLAVTSWDDTASHERRFEVKKANGQWTMVSAWGYPADGNARVTRTSTDLLGAERGQLVTADRKNHEELGVLDPRTRTPDQKKGFGKAVTLTDRTGAVALDVIIGDAVSGTSGRYYIRETGKDQVHTAKVDPDISTKFIDYVEADPFKLARDDLRTISVVDIAVNPDSGQVTPGAITAFARPAAGQDWASAQAPEGKKVNGIEVGKIVDELNGLRLVGVRPFRLEWLGARGIFADSRPQILQVPGALVAEIGTQKIALFGTEGRLDVATKDGLKYSFLFGKVALGDDADKDADSSKATTKEEAKADPAKPEAAPASTNRYLAVFVQYDEASDEVAKEEAAKAAANKDAKPDPKARKKGGKERAAKAQARFQQFFYVISDANFKALRPEIAKLFEDKPKPPPEPMAGATGKTNKDWLGEHAVMPGVTATASGLQYEVVTKGAETGPKPGPTDTVQVAYKGTLIDGTVFDENADMTFAVNGVIKGWTEALQLMRPGDQWKLTIPPELAYGATGSPPKIGPNAILQFEITLKAVVGK